MLKGILIKDNTYVFNLDGELSIFRKTEHGFINEPYTQNAHFDYYNQLLPINQMCEVVLDAAGVIYIIRLNNEMFFSRTVANGDEILTDLFDTLAQRKIIKTNLGSINLNFKGNWDAFQQEMKHSLENISQSNKNQLSFEVDFVTTDEDYSSSIELNITGLRYESEEEKKKREALNAKKAQKAKETAMLKKLKNEEKEKAEYKEFIRLKNKFEAK